MANKSLFRSKQMGFIENIPEMVIIGIPLVVTLLVVVPFYLLGKVFDLIFLAIENKKVKQ